MKRLFVVCMAVAFVAAVMISGCASQKAMADKPITGGTEGMARPGVDMGKPATSGAITGGSEGAARPGIRFDAPAPAPAK